MIKNKPRNDREKISNTLRDLRRRRGFTQADLAQRLGLGQGTYSRVENGNASLSAEQFLEVLRIFNVPVSAFEGHQDFDGDLQNALVRFGATHLLGDGTRLPSAHLNRVEEVFREVLADGTQSRHITALAPVFVQNHKDVQLKKLWAQFVAYGLEARLGWALENIQESLHLAILSGGTVWKSAVSLRAAERALEPFGLWLGGRRHRIADGPADLLGIKSLGSKSRAAVLASSSAISKRWGIISRIVPEDFFETLKAADVAR